MIPPPVLQPVGLYLPEAGRHHLLIGKLEEAGGGERQVVG
jgi:hypothetical protein